MTHPTEDLIAAASAMLIHPITVQRMRVGGAMLNREQVAAQLREMLPVREPAWEQVMAKLEEIRIVREKIDALIAALAADEDEPPQRTLDGEIVPGERDASQPL